MVHLLRLGIAISYLILIFAFAWYYAGESMHGQFYHANSHQEWNVANDYRKLQKKLDREVKAYVRRLNKVKGVHPDFKLTPYVVNGNLRAKLTATSTGPFRKSECDGPISRGFLFGNHGGHVLGLDCSSGDLEDIQRFFRKGGKKGERIYIVLGDALLLEFVAWFDAMRGRPDKSSGSFQRMLYFSVVTTTTLGYGDIVPLTDKARVLVAIQSIAGLFLMGAFLATLSFNTSSSRQSRAYKRQKGLRRIRKLKRQDPMVDEA
ncbi:MAG: two pore domain potassium channel family protein [Hyphomicrobiaceae bacterium]